LAPGAHSPAYSSARRVERRGQLVREVLGGQVEAAREGSGMALKHVAGTAVAIILL
jgi:hypothetical protein